MRTSWKPLLSLIARALVDGWESRQMMVHFETPARCAGRDWLVTITVGENYGQREARISLYRVARFALQSRRPCRLPSGAEARALNRVSDRVAKLGFRGGWSIQDGMGQSAFFIKRMKDNKDLQHELQVLKGVKLGEAKRRRS